MNGYQSDYGDINYDPNGYVNYVPTPDYGSNPWTPMVQSQQSNYSSAQNAAASMIPQMQQGLQSQIDAYQQAINPSLYPSFPNAGGLGNQMGYAQAQPQGSTKQADSGPIPRGLNPWSLQGEALSRY